MSRELATIRKISEIKSIEGADSIELAVVDGWQSVTKKGEYQAGDFVIYLEIDSWVPHELAPFLSKGKEPREYNGVKGERLRTVKLRGVLSQGLILPFTQQIKDEIDYPFESYEDGDVTELLGIQKWEKPIPTQLAGQVKGNFPSLIPKTDQERIQNVKQLVEGYYEVTEKLEGSSMTVGILNDEFIVCSRNMNLKEDSTNAFWVAARKYEIEEKLREQNLNNIILQGELVGPGIQGNIYNLTEYKFFVFDVYNVRTGSYLHSVDRVDVTYGLGLLHAPIINNQFLIDESTMHDDLLRMADGFSELNQHKLREGIVFKHNKCPDVSFKAISNEYLLKEK